MRHNLIDPETNSGDHWGVNKSTFFLPGQQAKVLVQLQQNGEQVRVAMTAEEAEYMAEDLLKAAVAVRAAVASIVDAEDSDSMTPG